MQNAELMLNKTTNDLAVWMQQDEVTRSMVNYTKETLKILCDLY